MRDVSKDGGWSVEKELAALAIERADAADQAIVANLAMARGVRKPKLWRPFFYEHPDRLTPKPEKPVRRLSISEFAAEVAAVNEGGET